MDLKLQWRKPLQIQDGIHKGEIIAVEKRTEPFDYIDIWIRILEESKIPIEIKYGCPAVLSEKSKLGRLVIALGFNYEENQEFDLENLKGKKITFMTISKKNKENNREYAEIVEDSIRLLN